MSVGHEAQPSPSVSDLFRNAFRRHPAGLAIISAAGPDGPAGILSSSVASVSLDPPALSFTISTLTSSAQIVRSADTVVVHLLDAGDLKLARTFATPGSVRFGDDMAWDYLPTGEPFLLETKAQIRCRQLGHLDVGNSSIVAAEVLGVTQDESTALPLVYSNRAFHIFHEFPIR
ncbi:flavin reductase family protein [Hoyosella subflava]|uniref:Flavin reductase-like domain protein n=1 Tax=Hoyosella subflava (strain DSM 45089 / JCM 17490 / NBRC 109087 / DQS3-9A1) TaxID=443218 RepID=F6EQM4_HOYSD|nr:flavin reductase family protein [Hoyosella subflava]AEF41901.1 Flavin reductase-like domain protein [Hoyosella subflava DQS3-9A1]